MRRGFYDWQIGKLFSYLLPLFLYLIRYFYNTRRETDFINNLWFVGVLQFWKVKFLIWNEQNLRPEAILKKKQFKSLKTVKFFKLQKLKFICELSWISERLQKLVILYILLIVFSQQL